MNHAALAPPAAPNGPAARDGARDRAAEARGRLRPARPGAPARPPLCAVEPPPRPGLRLRYDTSSFDNRDRWFIEKVVAVVDRILVPYHRAEVRGLERVPGGAALYVGNHSGGTMTIDSFLFGAALYRRHGFEGLPYVLTHDVALRAPLLHQVFSAVGGVRASTDNANRLFRAGHKVLVYPGGSEEALRPFRDRNRIAFGGHRGYVRIALAHGVPIVPVVGQGSHATFVVLDDARWMARALGIDKRLRVKAWGVTLSLPWGLTLFPPPLYLPLPARIRVEVLDPIRFERSGPEAAADTGYVAACARLVEERMQGALSRLAAE